LRAAHQRGSITNWRLGPDPDAVPAAPAGPGGGNERSARRSLPQIRGGNGGMVDPAVPDTPVGPVIVTGSIGSYPTATIVPLRAPRRDNPCLLWRRARYLTMVKEQTESCVRPQSARRMTALPLACYQYGRRGLSWAAVITDRGAHREGWGAHVALGQWLDWWARW